MYRRKAITGGLRCIFFKISTTVKYFHIDHFLSEKYQFGTHTIYIIKTSQKLLQHLKKINFNTLVHIVAYSRSHLISLFVLPPFPSTGYIKSPPPLNIRNRNSLSSGANNQPHFLQNYKRDLRAKGSLGVIKESSNFLKNGVLCKKAIFWQAQMNTKIYTLIHSVQDYLQNLLQTYFRLFYYSILQPWLNCVTLLNCYNFRNMRQYSISQCTSHNINSWFHVFIIYSNLL